MIQAWKIKHGLFVGSNGQKDKALSPEVRKVYRAWRSIKTRCFDKNSKAYKDYGARGITMSLDWKDDFPQFFMDVGIAPTMDHQIGRGDNDGHYTKNNCRWETRREQQNNRRCTVWVKIDDERIPLAELARKAGVSRDCMAYRVKMGFTKDRLLKPSPRAA